MRKYTRKNKIKRRGGGNVPTSGISEIEMVPPQPNPEPEPSQEMKLRKLIEEVKNIIKFKFEMNENMINENVKNMTNEEFENHLLEKKLNDEEKGDYRTFREKGTLLDTATNHGLKELYDELKELLDKRMSKKGGKWSRKYKRSINCRKPKGFSQKQYCKYGRKNKKRKTKRKTRK